MDTMIFRLAAVAIICVCFIGVFSCRFKDTFFQRIGLAVTAIGAFGLLFNEHEQTVEFFVTGVAIYSVATAVKVWRQEHGTI